MIFAIGTPNKRRAFTLIELVLVMTIMIVILGIVSPSLKGFFHARNLNNEARRFLSLTRYGSSRAIAEGVPVELWIDPRQSRYGLDALSGYTETQTNPLVYGLDQTVQISFTPPSSLLTHSNYWTQTLSEAQRGGLARIRFQPDGLISDTSPANIVLTQPDTGEQLFIAENSTHLRYELATGPPNRR